MYSQAYLCTIARMAIDEKIEDEEFEEFFHKWLPTKKVKIKGSGLTVVVYPLEVDYDFCVMVFSFMKEYDVQLSDYYPLRRSKESD